MPILFNPPSIPAGLAIAIGNFDGVHLGHKKIIEEVKKIAAEKNLKPAVITFEPHPLHLFKPEMLPIRITDLKSKVGLLLNEGIDTVIILKFDRKFSEIRAEDFVKKYLLGNHIITGHDFNFGYKREGNDELLKRMLGENYTLLEAVKDGDQIYSSSAIRKFLKNGEIKSANKILGHNYFITGRVQRGAGKGADFGFPTANIKLKPSLLRPGYGVYKVNTNFGRGVANFGVRPTVDGKTELLEVHIFGQNSKFDKNIYGEKLTTEFIDFIRREQTFASIDELKQQIEKDREIAAR